MVKLPLSGQLLVLPQIGRLVMDALQHELVVYVEYWEDGYIFKIVGEVYRVDETENKISLKVLGEYEHIDIDRLKRVERL